MGLDWMITLLDWVFTNLDGLLFKRNNFSTNLLHNYLVPIMAIITCAPRTQPYYSSWLCLTKGVFWGRLGSVT